MEHLVESHLGGYYVSNSDPEVITAYCESCGDSDWIILSWEEEQKMESFLQYFSELKYDAEGIKNNKQDGITKKQAIERIEYEYSFEDKNIIDALYEENVISEEEHKMLLKENLNAQKKQLLLIREIYSKDNKKSLKKQKRCIN